MKHTWTDETRMPWGTFKGMVLRDVPDKYKLWLLQQRWLPDWPELFRYLKLVEPKLRADAKGADNMEEQPKDLQTYDDYLKDYRGF